MTRWLVTGATGMLGRDLTAALSQHGEDVVSAGHSEVDLADPDSVDAAMREYQPAIVVNCAAWTAVDDAEENEDLALAVNGTGPALLASACKSAGSTLAHVSTDYVFDGVATRPYAEGDATAPRTAYGRTKLAGERAVLERLAGSAFIVRTAWLYGAFGPNFVRTMMRLERTRSFVDVVDDQRGQPTWTVDVASQIIALLKSGAAPGVYHATASGDTTWFGLACEVFKLLGADPGRVRPITTAALNRAASRPAYSVLGHDAWALAGLDPIGDWREALHRALPALVEAEGRAQPSHDQV